MTIEITNEAQKSIRRIVTQIAEAGGDRVEKNVKDLLDDIYDSFKLIEQSDGPVGAKHPFSNYENARIVELSRYDSFVVVYLKNGKDVVILGLLNSWMTGI